MTIPQEQFNSLTANDNSGVGLKSEKIYDLILFAEKIFAVWLPNSLLNLLLSYAMTADLFPSITLFK